MSEEPKIVFCDACGGSIPARELQAARRFAVQRMVCVVCRAANPHPFPSRMKRIADAVSAQCRPFDRILLAVLTVCFFVIVAAPSKDGLMSLPFGLGDGIKPFDFYAYSLGLLCLLVIALSSALGRLHLALRRAFVYIERETAPDARGTYDSMVIGTLSQVDPIAKNATWLLAQIGLSRLDRLAHITLYCLSKLVQLLVILGIPVFAGQRCLSSLASGIDPLPILFRIGLYVLVVAGSLALLVIAGIEINWVARHLGRLRKADVSQTST
jgi:hypothetical protein